MIKCVANGFVCLYSQLPDQTGPTDPEEAQLNTATL